MHIGGWRRLELESCEQREKGRAKGSWDNKVCNLRHYIHFTTHYGVPDFPVHLGILLRFIALLGRGPFALTSAKNILSSLKWFTSLLDPPSVKVFDSVLVSVSLNGLKAQLSRPVRQKLPVTLSHLCTFYVNLDLANMKHLSCWCAMLIAFFGCFRLSNLVPSSKSKFDPCKHLKRDDVRFEKDLVFIFYKWSKTNQHCSKVSWVPICSVADERFNIKRFLQLLLASVPADDIAPLFSFAKKDFHSRHTLVRLLDKCVVNANLSLSDYSWHSFRRGAAVFAFELGLADSAVQLLGDWSSSAFKNYLEFSFLRKVSIAEQIAVSFNNKLKQL